MSKAFILLLSLFIVTSCTNKDSVTGNFQRSNPALADTANRIITVDAIDEKFELDMFRVVPDTIDGCGEYFTYDTSAVKNDKYIFLSNFTDFAIIKIKGKDIYLNKDTSESKEINDQSYITVYEGQGYKAILNVKQTQAYDEGGFYSGTLQIIGDKVNEMFKVHGEAGC